MSIVEQARACNQIYWNLQTAILNLQAPVQWAFQVLPEADLHLVANNLQALEIHMQQIEAYSNALQVHWLLCESDE